MSQRIANLHITTDEYEEIGRAGLFDPEKRLELLEGEIYEMAPTGSRHVKTVNRLAKVIYRSSIDSVIVNIQNPIRLSDLSEPVPDLALVNLRVDEYGDALAGATDVLLLIEVADSSTGTDRKVKLPLYAIAEIPEVWLVDINQQKIVVFTAPVNGDYSVITEFTEGMIVRSSNVIGLEIPVNEILG